MATSGTGYWPNEGKLDVAELIHDFMISNTTRASTQLEVGLFKDDWDVSDVSVEGDIDEADFDGYLSGPDFDWGDTTIPSVIGFDTERIESNEARLKADSSWVFPIYPSPVTTNTIYGFFIRNAGPPLLWVFKFDTPIELVDSPDEVEFVPDICFGAKAVSSTAVS